MASPIDASAAAASPAVATTRRSSIGRIVWLTTLSLLFIYLISLFVPWQPTFPPGHLDISWCMALHWAFVHRVDFGHEFVFTFGPWGFLWQGYSAGTFNLLIAGWMLFSGAFFAGILAIGRRLPARHWAAPLWMALVIGVAGAAVTQSQDVRMFSLSWLLIVVHFHADDRPLSVTKVLLAIAMALSSLVKFSVCLMAWSAIVVVSLDLVRRRKVPWIAVIYLGAGVALWVGASQPIGSLAIYLRHSLEISAHYATGEAFSQPTEMSDVFQFALCGMILLIVLIFAARSQSEGREVARPLVTEPVDQEVLSRPKSAGSSGHLGTMLAAAGLVCSLFIGFKAGYVRHDGHETIGTTSLAVIAILYAGALWRFLNSWPRKLLLAVGTAACICLSWHSDVKFKHVSLPGYLAGTVISFPGHLQSAMRWVQGTSTAEQEYQKFLADIRGEFAAPAVTGSVDNYSWEQRVLFAYKLDYRPRPVIQSYLTLTSELAQMNADFLRGPGAPDSVLFDVGTIDQRIPSEDDGVSWPLLLTRYDLVDASTAFLWLKRAGSPREFSIEQISRLRSSLNEWIGVPVAADPIWVRIELKPTLLRKVAAALYKPRNVSLVIKTADGEIRRMGIVPEMAASGFLLSPLVLDRWDFAALESNDWEKQLSGARVTDISMSADTPDGTSGMYESDYQITFSRLHFPHRDVSSVPGLATHFRMVQFNREAKVQTDSGAWPAIDASTGELLFMAPAGTRIVVSVPQGGKIVQLRFGVLDKPAEGNARVWPVKFSAYAVDEAGAGVRAGQLLWSRTLDAAGVSEDRGAHASGIIALPTPAPVKILLQTDPTVPGGKSDSYWSDVEFK